MTKSRWIQVFLFGVIAILGLLFLSYLFFRGSAPRQESVVANSETLPALTLGGFTLIEGTEFYLAEIYNDNNSSSYFGYSSARWLPFSGSGWPTRNFVFLDGDSLESHKLFDTNESLILSVVPFPEKSSQANDPQNQIVVPVQWFVYFVIHEDSDNDGLLNENDQGVLAVSDFNGLRYKEILPGVLNLYELTMPENGRLLVIYKTMEGRYASIIDMPAQEIINTEPLPDLGEEVE